MYTESDWNKLRSQMLVVNKNLINYNKYIWKILVKLWSLTNSESLLPQGIEDVKYIVNTFNRIRVKQKICYSRLESFRRLCSTYGKRFPVLPLSPDVPFDHIQYGIYKYHVDCYQPLKYNLTKYSKFEYRTKDNHFYEKSLIKSLHCLPYVDKKLNNDYQDALF